jgi:hypothetical protein
MEVSMIISSVVHSFWVRHVLRSKQPHAPAHVQTGGSLGVTKARHILTNTGTRTQLANFGPRCRQQSHVLVCAAAVQLATEVCYRKSEI